MSDINIYGWNGCNVLDSRHYDHVINVKEWEAIEKALESGPKWVDFKLKRFDGECTTDFEARVDAASNVLKVATPLQAMQNLARGSKDQARVEGASDRVQGIVDGDFDNNGNSWFNWTVDKALRNTPAYGKFYIFASSPSNVSEIMLSDEKDNNPFVFGRNPLQVLNYRYENGDTRTQGQYSDILFLTSEVVVNGETLYEDQVNIAVRMTREATFVIAVDTCKAYTIDGLIGDFSKGDVIRMIPNEAKIVTCRSVDIGESIIKELVNLSAQAMNVQSASYISTVDANFNQKWTAGEGLPESFTSGEMSVIQFNKPESSYNVTDAPSGTIDNSIKAIDHIQNLVDTIMQNQYQNLAKKGGNAPSGEALTEMNSSQAQAVGYQMDMIGDALGDIVAWLHLLGGEAIPEDLKVIMPSTYESTTQADNMALSLDAQELTAHSEKALEVKLTAKWSPITPSEDLEEVVKAEMAAEMPLLEANNVLTLASADSIDSPEGDGAGNGNSQAEAEGDVNVD